MPRCSRCGQENPEVARFCLACAAPLGTEPAREVRKTVTVLFCDLVGSTSMGERIDPESLRKVMSSYAEEMRGAIERHGGEVEKFIGDAVMAVFGVPTVHEDDALRAVRAAADMGAALGGLNEDLERRWGVRLATRMGVNTGEVVAGDPSGGPSFIVGDAVNVAARLEQAAPTDEVLIGSETHRLVRDAVTVEPVEPLRLKGKSEPVPAFRLLEVIHGAHGLGRRLDSPLVGRDQELATLKQAFERSLDQSRCELVTVIGDAGVGKSRLVNDLTDGLGTRARILSGRCLPYGEGITFWPVAEAVRGAAEIGDSDTPEVAVDKLTSLIPAGQDHESIAGLVCGALGLAPGGAPSEEIFWAIRRLFEVLATDEPLVVVFDDVQWGETIFLDLIEYLGGHLAGAPVLLLCMSRPELRELRASLTHHAIALESLGDAEAERLVGTLLGDDAITRELATKITQTAEGNPLFVEEMVRMLVDDGLLRHEDGQWTAQGKVSELAAPSSVQALIAARVDRLGPGERGVLDSASVIGQEFWRGAVRDLSDDDSRRDCDRHLLALVEKELVRAAGDGLANDVAYRFGHILFRDVTYEALLKEARAELHERFADWLEARVGERVAEYEEILGYHLEQAFRYHEALGPLDEEAHVLAGRAGTQLGAAGQRALARSDFGAGVNLLERAAQLLPEHDAQRLELLIDCAIAFQELGELDRARQLLDQVIEATESTGQQRLRLHALVQRTQFEANWGSATSAGDRADLARETVQGLEEIGDQLGLARAWLALATTDWQLCRASSAGSKYERALRHAREAGAQREADQSLIGLAACRTYGPTPVTEAIAVCEELLDEDIGRRLEGILLTDNLGYLYAMQGDFDRARELYQRGQAINADLGLEFNVAGGTQLGGMIEMLASDPVAAEQELRRGYDGLGRLGEECLRSCNAALLARAILEQGRDAEAEDFVRAASNLATDDNLATQITVKEVQARLHARRNDVVDAEGLGRKALELADSTDLYDLNSDTRLALGGVLLASGDREGAAAMIEAALELQLAKGDVVSTTRTRELLSDLRS